jgi:hypothetical protein
MIIGPRNKLWLLGETIEANKRTKFQNSMHREENEVVYISHMDAGKRCLVSIERGEVPIVPLIFI